MSRSPARASRPVLHATIVAALACAGWLLHEIVAAPAPQVVTATRPTRAARLDGRYDFQLQMAQHLDVGEAGGVLSTALELHGRLALREGTRGEVLLWLVDAALDGATLGGRPVTGMDAVLSAALNQGVRLRYTPDGRFVGVDVPKTLPEAAQGVFQAIGATLQRGEPTSERTEETALGQVHASYTAVDGELVRHRDRYVSIHPSLPGIERATMAAVESETRFRLDPDGTLAGMAHDEHTVGRKADGASLVDDRAHLDLAWAGPAGTPPAVSSVRPVAVGEIAPDANGDRATLVAAVDGLTPDMLVDMLLHRGNTPAMPDHSQFLWRALSLLHLRPEVALRLAQVYAEMPPGTPGRGLVLDLLAQTDTLEAQETLVAVLGSDGARRDPDYWVQFQRVGLARHPASELVEMVRNTAVATGADGADKMRAPAYYALGAVAGNLARHAQPADLDELQALAAPLFDALNTAETQDADDPAQAKVERIMALRALGNAGLPETTEAVARSAKDPDSEVRRAAVAALRRVDTADGRAVLLRLTTDADPDVAGEAVRTLQDLTLDGDGYASLQALAGGDGLDTLVAEELVNTLSFHRAEPAARAALQALAARPELPGRLRARIEALLG